MTKLTVCTAVILSLAFTANLSAQPTIFLDANSLAEDSYPVTTPLIIATPYGNITFVGEIRNVLVHPNDVEFIAAGASVNAFDILDLGTPGSQTAELFFDDFDVESIEFIYGGNIGSILIEARDKDGVVLASFYQDSTFEEPAGPETLYGSGIRSLYWTDTKSSTGFAALDNITITIIPSPSAVVLAGIGVSFVSWLRKRKIV